MKYIVLGHIDRKWAQDPENHIGNLNKKSEELGITIHTVYYTQGDIDFIEVVQAPSPDAMLSLSLWYLNEGYGRLKSMPAFDMSEIDIALAKVRTGEKKDANE